VIRLYSSDNNTEQKTEDKSSNSVSENQKLYNIIQEALSAHLHGIKFRERNAGTSIDEHMCSEGFDIEIGVDLETGFVFGGNKYNCGTWMDKMGSSNKASNKGIPATPRDGSAVELVGLSRHVLDWLIKMEKQGAYPYNGVIIDCKSGKKITWIEWAEKIDKNFEKYFWIDQNSKQSRYINHRNIYKDTYG
jgi:glycogen debranching enzyme